LLIPWKLLCDGSEEADSLLEGLLGVGAADPIIFDEIMRGMVDSDPCVQIQAAEMVEEITRARPLFLTPYRRVLVNEMARIELVKVRQQVAILYGRALWDEWDMKQVVALLGKWIEREEDEQIIINSIESLAVLGKQKEWILPILRTQLQLAMDHTQRAVRDVAGKLQV
jgi:hypothetical protein